MAPCGGQLTRPKAFYMQEISASQGRSEAYRPGVQAL
jgi:hypothetical protein